MSTPTWRLVSATIALVAGTMAMPPSPARAADQYGIVRLVNAVADATNPSITTSVDGGPPAALSWVTASAWQVLPAGRHTVSVIVGDRQPTELAVDLPGGCPTTFFLISRADLSVAMVQSRVCSADRIPPGEARISAVAQLESDLGPVEARLPGLVTVLAPDETTPRPVDVPAGPVSLVVGAPGSDEVYAKITPVLEEHSSYTLLYAGGGETPAALILLPDGRQAPAPPSPDTPIRTGLPSRGAGGWVVLGVLLALSAVLGRRRGARRLAGLGLALLLCAGCQMTLAGSDAAPGTNRPTGRVPAPTTPMTPPVSSSSPPAGTGPAATPSVPAWPRGSAPSELDLPSLQQTWPLGRLSAENLLRLPASMPLHEVAWLEGTSEIGTPGTTVVLGHTTAPGRTPGPFNRLGELRTGDQVEVRADDGSVYDYVVASVDAFPKGHLPPELYAPQAVPTLLLITCTDGTGPPGAYQDNLVVTALGEGTA